MTDLDTATARRDRKARDLDRAAAARDLANAQHEQARRDLDAAQATVDMLAAPPTPKPTPRRRKATK